MTRITCRVFGVRVSEIRGGRVSQRVSSQRISLSERVKLESIECRADFPLLKWKDSWRRHGSFRGDVTRVGGVADRFRRIVSSSAAFSPRRGTRKKKVGKKEEKRCVRGFLEWNSGNGGGDTETSLSGAETTGPRTSRGPDSTLLRFSLFLSISLSLFLFHRVPLSIRARASPAPVSFTTYLRLSKSSSR